MASPLTNLQAEDEEAAAPEAAAPKAPVRDLVQEQLAKYAQNRQILDAQIEKLKGSLQERTALPFDPMLMRIAAAAGRPTKTGSLFEGVGNVATDVMDEARKEQDRRAEIEKAKYDLALKQYEMQNQALEQQGFLRFAQSRGMMGAQPEGVTLRGGVPVGGAPAGGEAQGRDQALASVAPPPGVERRLTPEDVAELSILSPKFGKIYQDMNAARQKGLVNSEAGIWDSYANNGAGGWLIKYPGAKESTAPFIGKQTFSNDQWEKIYREKSRLDGLNMPVEQQKQMMYDFYVKEGLLESKLSPTTGKSVAITPTEKAEQEKFTAADIETLTKEKAEAAKGYTARAEAAPTMRQLGSQNLELIKNPATRELIDKINSSGDFKARFAELVSQGLTTPGGIIAAPGYKEFLRLLDAKPEQISAFQQLAANSAQVAAMASREYLAGQGSVTENERRMIELIGPSVYTNTPMNLAFKSQVMVARAKFNETQEQLYNKWRRDPANQRKYASEFKESPEWTKLRDDYDRWFSQTSKNYYPNANLPSFGGSSSGTGSLEDRVRKQAGQ